MASQYGDKWWSFKDEGKKQQSLFQQYLNNKKTSSPNEDDNPYKAFRGNRGKSPGPASRGAFLEAGFQTDTSFMNEYIAAVVNPRVLRWTTIGFAPDFASLIGVEEPQQPQPKQEEPESSQKKKQSSKKSFSTSLYNLAVSSLSPEERLRMEAHGWYTRPEIMWAFKQMGLYDYVGVFTNPILKGQVEKVAKLSPYWDPGSHVTGP